MENLTIIAQSFVSKKSGNKFWKVSVAEPEAKVDAIFCGTPLKAIRAMYILAKRTEGKISDEHMKQVCLEHYRLKKANAEAEASEKTAEAETAEESAPVKEQEAPALELTEPKAKKTRRKMAKSA